MRRPARVVLAVLGLAALAAGSTAVAQSLAAPAAPDFSQPMLVGGYVTMASGLTVDGGIRASSLEVSGDSTFRARPTGVVLSGDLARPTALTLGIGCASLGAVTVPGAASRDACVVSGVPAGGLALAVVYDCAVTGVSSVAIRGCGLVAAVAAPAGIYSVRVIGP